MTHRGKVSGGQIVLDQPLTLPEGTAVNVVVEPITEPDRLNAEEFAALPFFGMWADRQDIGDSAAWVHQEREKWQQRPQRQDS